MTMDEDSKANQTGGGPCPSIRIPPLRDIVKKPELFCVDYTGSVINGRDNEAAENGTLNVEAQFEDLNAPSSSNNSSEIGMNLPEALANFVPFPYEGPILSEEMLDEWVKNRDTQAAVIDQVASGYFALPDEDSDDYDAGSEGSEDSELSSSSSSKSILVPQRPVARKSVSLRAARKQWNRMLEQVGPKPASSDGMNCDGKFSPDDESNSDVASSPEIPFGQNSGGLDSPARGEDSQATIPIRRRPASPVAGPPSPVAQRPATITARPFPRSPAKSSSPDAEPPVKKSAKEQASRTPAKITAKPRARLAAKKTAGPKSRPSSSGQLKLCIPASFIRNAAMKLENQAELTESVPSPPVAVDGAKILKPSLALRNPSWTPEIERAAQEMYFQLKRQAVNRAELERLLECTFPYRRSAYEDPELADVPTIFRNFPALRDYRCLKNELTLLKQLNWSTFEEQLLDKCSKSQTWYAHDPLIASGHQQLNNVHSDDAELQMDLSLLFLGFQKTKGKLYGVLYKLMNEDEELFLLNDLTPTIDIRGNLGDQNKTIRVYCEGILVANAPNFFEAMLCVYAMYWLYGIVYPKAAEPFLKFLDELSGLH